MHLRLQGRSRAENEKILLQFIELFHDVQIEGWDTLLLAMVVAPKYDEDRNRGVRLPGRFKEVSQLFRQ